MKIALHVHTNLSDAYLDPEEIIKVYDDLGFGAIAITDHEFLLRENYHQVLDQLDRRGMIIMIGVEIDYLPWNYHHLLRIQGENQTLHVMAHPSAYYLEIDEIVQRINSEPFKIDAVEITHRGVYQKKYDDPEITIPKIASDDAHQKSDCGRAWIETDDLKNADRIIQAVKADDFEIAFLRGTGKT